MPVTIYISYTSPSICAQFKKKGRLLGNFDFVIDQTVKHNMIIEKHVSVQDN